MYAVCTPRLLATHSYRAQGCAAGQYNDLHLDVYECFVRNESEGPTTSTMQRTTSVGKKHR